MANIGQKALLGLGGAAITGGALAIHLADTWEAQHARLANAIANAGGNIGQFTSVIKAADQANEKYGLSADQTEGALATLTQATNNPKKAFADLSVAINLAAAKHIDLNTAATIVGKVAQGNTTILKRYGIDLGITSGNVAAVTKAHDSLAKAQQNLKDVETKLGVTHGTSAAQSLALQKAQDAVTLAESKMGGAHLSAAASAAKLTAAHDAVVKANAALVLAHDRLTTVEAKIQTGRLTGTAAAQALAAANLAIANASNNLQQKQQAASLLQDKLNSTGGATLAQQLALQHAQETLAAIEGKLGGQHGLTATQAIQLAKAHAAVDAATQKLNTTSGAAGTAIDALGKRFGGAAAAQAETFHGKLAALEAQGKDFGIQAGLVLIPIIERLAGAFTKVLSYLEQHKAVLIVVAGLFGTVLVAAIGAYIAQQVIAAATTVASFASMIAKAVAWAATNTASFGETIAIQSLYLADTVSTAATTAAAWVASSAESVAAFATHAAAAVASSAVTVAAWVADAAAATAAFIAENAAMLGIGVAIAALVAGIIWLVTNWSTAWNAIKSVASAAWQFLQGVFAPVVHFFEGIFDDVEHIITGVIAWIGNHWQLILAILIGPVGLAILFVKDHFHEIADTVSKVLDSVVGFFTGLPQRIITGLSRIISAINSDVIQPLLGVFSTAIDNIVGFFLGLPERILTAIHDLEVKIGTFFLNLGVGAVKAMVQGIENVAGDLMNEFEKIFKDALKHLPGGGLISKGLSALGFDEGGPVPGPVGAPMLAVVHGGEFVLSNDMLRGARPASAAAASSHASALQGDEVTRLLTEIADWLKMQQPTVIQVASTDPQQAAVETVNKLRTNQWTTYGR